MRKRRLPEGKKRRHYARKRFSFKNIDPSIAVSVCCVLAVLIFAVILGNVLGAIARDSSAGSGKDKTTVSLTLPHPDVQGAEVPDISAHLADMSSAVPDESLSTQTADARGSGNALYIPMQLQSGAMVYSSEKTASLGVPSNENLTLSRLREHFNYYDDYVCGRFVSNLSPSGDPLDTIDLRAREHTLIAEASEYGFDEIVVSFSSGIAEDGILLYQAYLLDLKLTCPELCVGVALSKELCESEDASLLISKLLSVADFCTIDLSGAADTAELEESLLSLLYFIERYPSRVIVSYTEDTLDATLSALNEYGVSSAIFVKK